MDNQEAMEVGKIIKKRTASQCARQCRRQCGKRKNKVVFEGRGRGYKKFEQPTRQGSSWLHERGTVGQ